MADKEALAILKSSVSAWNTWRTTKQSPLSPDLIGAGLAFANLHDANLAGADLTVAKLHDAVLDDSDLSGANLTGADLGFASLNDADLSGANLTGADLTEVNLTGANLQHAQFGDTIFVNDDLSKCIGLQLSIHRGPSVLDYPP